jgi:hypothetical protein
MKTKLTNKIYSILVLITLGVFLAVLTSCQVEDSSASLSRDVSSMSLSDQLIYQLGLDLQTAGLSDDQVTALQQGAVNEITTQSLDTTSDASAVAPAVLKGVMMAIPETGLATSEAKSAAVNSVIQSLMGSLNGKISAASASAASNNQLGRSGNRQLSATGDAYSNVLDPLVATAIGYLDDAGFAVEDVGDAVEGIVSTVIANFTAVGLPADDVWDLTSKVVTSAVGSIDEAGVTLASFGTIISKAISGSMNGLSALGRTDEQIGEAADDIAEAAVWGLGNLTGVTISNSTSYITTIKSAVQAGLTTLNIPITSAITAAINSATQNAVAGAFDVPNNWGAAQWGVSMWKAN